MTGTLALEIMCGTTPIGYTNSKHVVIYRDHLQHGMENFVAQNLTTNHSRDGVMHGGANALGFACHQSTMHAYQGEKGPTNFWADWAVCATALVERGYQDVPDLGTLSRGDIVAYYYSTDVFTWDTLRHSQTCTGNSNETWGANNNPMFLNNPWKFASAAAGSMYMNYTNPSTPCWTIRVYKKL